MDICEENDIIISPKKIQYSGPEKFVIFVRMKLIENECSQDQDKMQAINNYLRSEHQNSSECYLEICKQFQFWFPETTAIKYKMHALLQKEVPYV